MAFFRCLAALLFLTLNASAQTSKGAHTLGGDFSGSHQKTLQAEGRQTRLDVTFQPGRFVDDNVLLGLGLSLRYDGTRYPNGLPLGSTDVLHSLRSVSWGLAPFVQFYFLNTRLRPLLALSLGYRRENLRGVYTSRTVGSTTRFLEGEADVGAAYFVSNHLVLELKTGLRATYEFGRDDVPRSAVLRLGFRILLPQKEGSR